MYMLCYSYTKKLKSCHWNEVIYWSSQNTWSLYFLTSWYVYQTHNMPVQQNWLRHYTDMWILIFTRICNLNCLCASWQEASEKSYPKSKLLTIWTHLISERTISDCYECPLLWSSFLTAWQPPQVPQILVCIVWLNDLSLCVELLSSPLLSSPLLSSPLLSRTEQNRTEQNRTENEPCYQYVVQAGRSMISLIPKIHALNEARIRWGMWTFVSVPSM